MSVSSDAYKIKGKALKDEGACNFTIEITKVDDTTNCIEFNRKSVSCYKNYFEILGQYFRLLQDCRGNSSCFASLGRE